MNAEEIKQRQEKIKEDYNRIANNLNERFKNPERYISRKHSGKKKFGNDILKRLNKKE